MEVTVRTEGGVTVIGVAGRLDAETVPAAQKAFKNAIPGNGRDVLIDLAALDYVSSAGLRLFLATAKDQRAGGGGFRVCSPGPSVRQVFDISGFTEILNVSDTEDDALKAF